MDNPISVIIVTYNRQKDVMETIESLLFQTSKPLEIIVIDNGSDPPLDVKLNIKNLKLIRFDEEVGLSNARNYGIKIARGDYVAFIDDDAVANKHWLEEIQKGINMGADIIGGALEPIYEVPPPRWWNEKILGGYAGIGNIWNKYVYGSNMVISKKVLEKIGLFRTEIGRQKGKLLSGEDTDLIERAKRFGFSVLFVPQAVVYHKVKKQRMTLKYILEWEYYTGKSQKLRNGYKPLSIGLSIVKALFDMANPHIIFSDKATRIRKIAGIINLLAQLF